MNEHEAEMIKTVSGIIGVVITISLGIFLIGSCDNKDYKDRRKTEITKQMLENGHSVKEISCIIGEFDFPDRKVEYCLRIFEKGEENER